MSEIRLASGSLCLLDEEDYERLKHYRWFLNPRVGGNRYARRRRPDGGFVLMHQDVMGPAPKGCEIDHTNGNGLDNRRTNLRFVSHADNIRNQKLKIDNTSGRKGVHRFKGRWCAQIKVNYRLITLGRFDDLDEAARAYDLAALEYFGPAARTNAKLGLLKERRTA